MKENILIVDDDVSILEGLGTMLTEHGYDVDTAEDEAQALENMDSKKYHIAIVDLVLKETNGLDLISKLQETYSDIITIALTGQAPREYVAKSFRNGAVKFLTKPCSRENLIAAICQGLELREDKKNSKDKIQSRFPWEKIIHDNPSCVDTILEHAKRKIDKEIFKEVKRCKSDFDCLLSEKLDSCLCPVESYISANLCFIKKESRKNCISGNQLSFGYGYICNCPVRAELYRKYAI